MTPTHSQVRFRVDPRGVPPVKAARRLGLPLGAFEAKTAELYARGFPRPDPTTGNYDLAAIDAWMDRQQAILSQDGLGTVAGAVPGASLTERPLPRNAREVFGERARRVLDGAR